MPGKGRLLVATICGVLAASGCGAPAAQQADGDPARSSVAASADPSAAAPPPVAAYAAWLRALQTEDATEACARHAPELTIALRQEAILRDRAELGDPCTGFVGILWEDPVREYEPLGVEVTRITGEDAVLASDFPERDQTITMVQRNGAWFVADSSPRADAGPEPQRWLAGWCDLELGMDRDALVAVMGEPSGEYSVTDGGEPQLYWTRRQYDFRAYLDPAGLTLDLVGDYDALSATDRDSLTCPELR